MKKKDIETPSPRSREPQSYGSNRDWLEGKTPQTVNETPHKSSRTDEEFYEPERDSDESPGAQGGELSAVQIEEGSDPPAPDKSEIEVTGTATTKISEELGREGSYFRDRDYS